MEESFGWTKVSGKTSGIRNSCGDAQHIIDNVDQVKVGSAEVNYWFTSVELLKRLAKCLKERCRGIALLQAVPMLALPLWVTYLDIRYELALLVFDGNCNPGLTLHRLYLVAVTPVVFCKLHIVINYKFIDRINNVEIALPRDVVGLEDCDSLNCQALCELIKSEGSREDFCSFNCVTLGRSHCGRGR